MQCVQTSGNATIQVQSSTIILILQCLTLIHDLASHAFSRILAFFFYSCFYLFVYIKTLIAQTHLFTNHGEDFSKGMTQDQYADFCGHVTCSATVE